MTQHSDRTTIAQLLPAAQFRHETSPTYFSLCLLREKTKVPHQNRVLPYSFSLIILRGPQTHEFLDSGEPIIHYACEGELLPVWVLEMCGTTPQVSTPISHHSLPRSPESRGGGETWAPLPVPRACTHSLGAGPCQEGYYLFSCLFLPPEWELFQTEQGIIHLCLLAFSIEVCT